MLIAFYLGIAMIICLNLVNVIKKKKFVTTLHGILFAMAIIACWFNCINSLTQGFDRANSLYQKLWDHLGKMEKQT